MTDSTTSPGLRHLLHLEDSLTDAELIHAILAEEWPGCQIQRVQTRADFLAALEQQPFDLILSDFSMPGFDGLTALKLVRQRQLEIPFIFFSGTIGEENAMEALRCGATDYIIKDRPARLVSAVQGALEQQHEFQLRQRAELRLHEQAELLDKARDAICVTDLAQRITYWNASAERLYGWTAAEAIGRQLGELDLGYDAARFAAAHAQLLASGEWRGTFRLRNKNGDTLQVESTWSLVLTDKGKPRSILFIDTDVTEKMRLETQLLRAGRLDSIGMLAGGVAHDLNNALAPILMGSELLRLSVADPKNLRLIETIETSAQHGAALVRQLLAFARGGEGERAEIRMAALLEDVPKLLRQSLPRDIALEVSCAESALPILADATQIKQLLLNLCLNARDAMPEGGRLEVKARNTTVDSDLARLHPGAQPGPHLLVSVQDTGTGIPPAVLEKIFDPFFTTKSVGKGTGLGLSTVAGIVKSHGGFLQVESQVGHGTVFRLFFPGLLQSPPATARPVQPLAEGGRGETILIIDDDANVRDTFRLLLEKAGYQVATAEDGEAGIAAFATQRNDIAVVITDMMMPGLSGRQVVTALRALAPSVRIIAVSGFSGADENPPEVAAMLAKPVNVAQLLGTLRRVIAA